MVSWLSNLKKIIIMEINGAPKVIPFAVTKLRFKITPEWMKTRVKELKQEKLKFHSRNIF